MPVPAGYDRHEVSWRIHYTRMTYYELGIKMNELAGYEAIKIDHINRKARSIEHWMQGTRTPSPASWHALDAALLAIEKKSGGKGS